METPLLIKQYPIFVIVLSAILVGVSLPFLGNAWAQERGLVIPELADVAPPANTTNATEAESQSSITTNESETENTNSLLSEDENKTQTNMTS